MPVVSKRDNSFFIKRTVLRKENKVCIVAATVFSTPCFSSDASINARGGTVNGLSIDTLDEAFVRETTLVRKGSTGSAVEGTKGFLVG